MMACGFLAFAGAVDAGVVKAKEGETVQAKVGDTVRCEGFSALPAEYSEKVVEGKATVKPCEDCKVIPGGPAKFNVTAKAPGKVVVELTMKMNDSDKVEKKRYTIDFQEKG